MQVFLWDTAKARINRDKHGVDFEEAATVFRDPLLLVQPDVEHSQDEERWLALGRSARSLLLISHPH
jgi:uncharacterized protein